MAGGAFGRLFRYGESEIDPAVRAEVLLESARSEARTAILELLVAVGFGLLSSFQGEAFRAVALFCIVTVLPMLTDSWLRRSAARRLRGHGPQPVPRAKPGLR